MSNDRGIMAGRVTGRWQKFPNFIEYANDCTTFQRKTEATLTRAWWLAVQDLAHSQSLTVGIPTESLRFESYTASLLWVFDTAEWSYEFIWEELSTNQSEFKGLLDAIINRDVLPVHIELLEKHDNHVRIDNCWLYTPWEILPSYRFGPSLQSYEHMRIQDPLDGIYWPLGKFLRLGGEQRLRKCPVCERYFIQPTARPQAHCGDACRLKGDPNRREANADYQSSHREKVREMRIQKGLRKVKETKAQLRAQGIKEPGLERVLAEAKISNRWWNSLCGWEIKHHGRPRITDLTRP
jgi:hypothetical protein